jgi:hypothetical protein
MDIEAVIQEFRTDPQFAQNIVEWRTIPARDASYRPFPPDLSPDVV